MGDEAIRAYIALMARNQTPQPQRWEELLTGKQLDCLRHVQKNHDLPSIARALDISLQAVARNLIGAAIKLERVGDTAIASSLREAAKAASVSPKPNIARRSRNSDRIPRLGNLRVVIREASDLPEDKKRGGRKDISRPFGRVRDNIPKQLENNPTDLVLITKTTLQTGIDPRWEELERFAIENKGIGVAARGHELFPEFQQSHESSVALPTEAPETYQGLRGPETPPAFVQRVYGPWLGHGLTRAHIRTLDSKLYDAINNWTSRPGNEWPAEVDLPTKAEQNTRDLETLRATAADGQIGRVLGDFTAREAGRIRSALQRREK